MKKMKTLLLIPAISLLFAACSKKDNKEDNNGPSPIGPKTPQYIASYVTLSRLGDSVRYDYNGDRTLKRYATYVGKDTSSATTFIYYPQYAGGQLTGIYESRSTKDTQGAPWVSFNHNAAGQISRLNAKSNDYTTYAWDNEGRISEMRIYGPADTDSTITNFTWEGKNVVKVTSIGTSFGSLQDVTVRYTYENRWNPHSYMGLPLFFMVNDNSMLSDNNVKTATHVSNGKTYVTTYEYTYDSRNYPTHIKLVTTGYNNPITEEMDITYWPVY